MQEDVVYGLLNSFAYIFREGCRRPQERRGQPSRKTSLLAEGVMLAGVLIFDMRSYTPQSSTDLEADACVKA
jgi:hypothetical protein